MEPVEIWFANEVQRWRVGASLAWTQILLPITLFSAVLIVNVNFLHPVQWITNTLSVMHPSYWLYILLLALVMFLLSIWQAKLYTVRLRVLSTRLEYMWNMCNPNSVLFIMCHTLGTAIATWCFVNIVGGRFRGLSRPYKHDGVADKTVACVNECHLFVVIHGAVIGSLYALKFFATPYVLNFPIIQQSKFFHIKTQLYPLLKMSGIQVVSQLHYYYAAYFFLLGPLFNGWIAKIIKSNESCLGTVGGVYNLLDVSMLWCTVVSGTTIQFLLSLARCLYNTYQTEPFHFAIEGVFEEDCCRTLPKALTSKNLPIVQYLAYQDLCEVASHGHGRRKQMFTLSQPGGHAHNWAAISGACLSLLRDISTRMAEFNNSKMAAGSSRNLNGDYQPTVNSPVPKLNHSVMNGSLCTSQFSTPISNLSFRGPAAFGASPSIPSEKKADPTIPLMNKITNHLKKRKAIAFFIGELPDAASRRLYADSQIYMWAVDAISQLACASFKEDKYGVVQKTLPDIVSTLLSLQEVVEKHLKLAPNTNRKSGAWGSPTAPDMTQRHAMRAVIKTALYRIVNTFSSHLSSIRLSSEHSRRLRLFIEYKE